VRVTIENGEVVGYVQPSGHPLLVSATIDNIKSWKFDKTVRTTFETIFIYQFEMESEGTTDPSNPKLELELPSLAKITTRLPMPECNDCGDAVSK
jgi:hypothetical protein